MSNEQQKTIPLSQAINNWKIELSAAMSGATTISMNAFDNVANQLLKLSDEFKKVSDERNSLKTQVQSLEVQLKKEKDKK